MQLKQKYTIYNITYENELFISDESTNVNIKEIMEYFFNSINPVFNCSNHSEQNEVTNINTINNNESKEEIKSDSEELKTQPVQDVPDIKITGYQIADKPYEKRRGLIKGGLVKEHNRLGFYIKFKVGNNIIEKWSQTDSEDNAKAGIYNYISKLRKERNDTVDYEILEIKAMTLEEYNNKKSE